MISYIFNFITSKYFLIYWVICIFYVEYGLRSLVKLQPKNKEQKEIDEKYKAFRMIDTIANEKLQYRLIIYLVAPLSIFKFSVFLLSTLITATFIYISVSILGRKNTLFRYLAYITTTATGRILCWCASIIWITTERPKVCYKKYLGPDWKPSYDNPGSIVANHTSWADTAVTMSR